MAGFSGRGVSAGISIDGKTTGYSRALRDAARETKRFERDATRELGKWRDNTKRAFRAAATGMAVVGVAAVGAGVKMISLAADAAEVDSKLQVVFGKNLPKVSKELNSFAKATGASRYALRQQAADMGALLKPMGLMPAQANKMSVSMVKLATDLSSFNNIPVDEALQKIRAGLVGEAEPLRSVGVLLSEAAVKQEAYRLGIAKSGAELTEQQKVQARYSLIMKQTALAHGDATRTAGSMANQLRALQNNVRDTATEIGAKLIPYALAAVQAFNRHWPDIERVAGQVFGKLGTGIRALAAEFERNWPRIKRAGEDVAVWYKANLEPTMTSVSRNIIALWRKLTGDVETHTDRMGRVFDANGKLMSDSADKHTSAILRFFQERFRGLVHFTNAGLAALRGDWSTAWAELKAGVVSNLTLMVNIIKGFWQKVWEVAKSLGVAAAHGIVAGLKSAATTVGSSIWGVVKGGIDYAKDKAGIKSPSTLTRDVLGKPLSDGIVQGLLSGKIKVTDAMTAIVDAAVQHAQTVLSTKLGRFQAFAGQAFGLHQGAAQTPAEKRIAAAEDKRRQDDLVQGVKDAEANLAKVRADAGATPEDVAAAQKQLDDARYEMWLADQQKLATAERAALEQRQFIEQTNFNQRLQALQTYLESGHATTKGATQRIGDLLADFGITAGDMGELAGKLFAAGLRNSIPGVVDAAKDLATSAKNQQVVGQAGANAKARADAAAAAKAKAGKKGKGDNVGTLPGGLIEIGRALQAAGYQVGENPAFGGVHPVHAKNSYHYLGRAIDVNWPGGGSGELDRLQSVYATLLDRGGFAELLLEDIGKANQHLHIALARGGILPGSMLGDRGPAARRREAVLPLESTHGRTMLADAMAAAIEQAGSSGALVNIERMEVRRDDDAQLVASAVNRAWGIR